MERLTIVFVINRLKLGGAQRVIITLAHSLSALGHNVQILCFRHSEELHGAQDLNVLYFKRNLSFLPPPLRNRVLSRKLDAYIQAEIGTPDLILSNLSKANRIMMHSKLNNVHFVVHNTLSLLGQVQNMSQHKRLARLRRIRSIYMKKPCVCCSQGVYQDFVGLMPDHSAVSQIGNPLDLEQIRSWSQAYPSPYQDYIVHIGSIIEQKRHDRLLNAYKESGIKQSLVLVGTGELEQDVRRQAKQLGIEDKVIFAGFHSNPYPIIAGAELMVLSSDYEGLGVVLLESLALGVPAVSTDCESGPREILPKANLVDVDDVSALATLIRSATNNRAAFTSAVPEQFDSQHVARDYLKLAHAKS